MPMELAGSAHLQHTGLEEKMSELDIVILLCLSKD